MITSRPAFAEPIERIHSYPIHDRKSPVKWCGEVCDVGHLQARIY